MCFWLGRSGQIKPSLGNIMKTKEQTLNTLSRLTDKHLKAFEYMVNKKSVTFENKLYFIENIYSDFSVTLIGLDNIVTMTSVSSLSF